MTPDLRELSPEELAQRLTKAKQELFDLRNKAAGAKLDKPHQIKMVRRNVARILTLLNAKASGS